MNKKAEEIRIRYLYRDMVLRGKLCLPARAAMKMVGPDSAYRLYALSGKEKQGKNVHRKNTPLS